MRRLPIGVIIAEQESAGDPPPFRYLFANEAAGEAGGITEQGDIGHFVGERLPYLLSTDLPGEMAATLEAGEVRELDVLSVRAPSGVESLYRVALLPLSSRIVAIFLENVTAEVRAERERETLMEELKRSNTDLEQFAYVASHDLQEPLRMVSGYTNLLARRYKGQLDADADEFIAYATDGCARLKNLIDDLLAYSRVQRAEISYEKAPAEHALGDAMSGLETTLRETGAEVERGPLPEVAIARSQLATVFQNLLGNAIKFRSEAPPRIEVSARGLNSDWLFSVADNGIGIDPRYATRIFDLFQRLHATGRYEGTGIGLALCKRIVERYGGRIWVEPNAPQGAVFYFTIPKRDH